MKETKRTFWHRKKGGDVLITREKSGKPASRLSQFELHSLIFDHCESKDDTRQRKITVTIRG